MAVMATNLQTYRVGDDVDVELRRLAGFHGSIDKALRVVMGWAEPVPAGKTVSVESVARWSNTPRPEKPFKGTLLKPKERNKKD